MPTIYLIDDDMDDVELFREALQEVDPSISLQYANDGHEAVRNLTEQKNVLPDLIFLDISMPVFNGLQCLASFKKDEKLKDLPVIMYTTSSQEREIRTAKELGASGFVTKPNNFKHLKRMLTLILGTPVEQLPAALQQIGRGFLTTLLFALVIAGPLSAQPRKKVTVTGKGFPKTEEVYYVLKDDNTKKDGPYEVIRNENVVLSGFYKNDQKDSVWEVYAPNNILLSRKWYQQGKRTGKWEFFTRAGEVDWTYDFNTNVLVRTPSERSKIKDTATYFYMSPSGSWVRDSLDRVPVALYSSGEWLRYLNTNLRYPDEAVNHNEQGQVIINITVDETGDAVDYTVGKSATPALDAEALRVVRKFNPEFVPAEKDGKKVRVQCRMPLVFKLEQQ